MAPKAQGKAIDEKLVPWIEALRIFCCEIWMSKKNLSETKRKYGTEVGFEMFCKKVLFTLVPFGSFWDGNPCFVGVCLLEGRFRRLSQIATKCYTFWRCFLKINM